MDDLGSAIIEELFMFGRFCLAEIDRCLLGLPVKVSFLIDSLILFQIFVFGAWAVLGPFGFFTLQDLAPNV
jgi:hypothetical protein